MQEIIDKVKKLLALAESDNPHEAFLAAKRARVLMDKHSISKEDIQRAAKTEFNETQSEFLFKQRNYWVTILHASVGTLNDCGAVIQTNKGEVKLQYQGFIADSIVAQMTLDYLINTCIRCSKQANLKGRSEHNQFKVGFARAISKRITELIAEREQSFVASTGTNLIPLKKAQIEQYFGNLPTSTSHKHREPTESEAMAYLSGQIAGHRTSLAAQVNGEETTKVDIKITDITEFIASILLSGWHEIESRANNFANPKHSVFVKVDTQNKTASLLLDLDGSPTTYLSSYQHLERELVLL